MNPISPSIAATTGRPVGPARRLEFYPAKGHRKGAAVDVSIILPTYNECANVKILLPRLQLLLNQHGYNCEILVIDDNSPDGTWRLVKEMADQSPGIRLIRRIGERGLSSAVVTGMASAFGRMFIVMDADLQHDEGIIPDMLAELERADLVVGTRLGKGGSYGEMGRFRRLLSRSAALFTRLLLDVRTPDPMSGFFALRREAFESVASRLNPRGFKILLEIASRSRGLRIGQVSYHFRARRHGVTKLDGSVIAQFILAAIELRFGQWTSSLFLKYAMIGSVGVLVNLLGQFIATGLLGLEYAKGVFLKPSLAVLIGFEASVLFNYLANNAFTFRDSRKQGLLPNVIGLGQFHAVAIYGFVIQLAVWNLLLGFFDRLWEPQWIGPVQRASYAANLVGILFATVNNFYLNKNFTWGQSARNTSPPASRTALTHS